MSSDERLSPLVLRRLNKTLTPLGLKVCAACQGHPQPLANFYLRDGGKGYKSECKACYNARSAVAIIERYRNDEATRERMLARNRAYWHANADALNAKKHARVKRAAFRRVLNGGAT